MILIYINTISMTCNGIMTLCKHRLVLATKNSRRQELDGNLQCSSHQYITKYIFALWFTIIWASLHFSEASLHYVRYNFVMYIHWG